MIETNRKDLGRALAALKPAVSRRPGIPALEGVLLEADGSGSATLTATDLELGVVVKIEAAGEAARLLVPFKLLAETVKTGAGERVRLEAGEGTAHVDGASIRLLPVEDFPMLTGAGPEYAGTIEAESFKRGAAAAVASASKDEARPVLTGVLVELGARAGEPTGARLVATDSYRLHVAHVDGHGEWVGIVPARALKLVAGQLGRNPSGVVAIAGGDSEVRFVLPDGLEVRSRVIEGEYPNYRQLLPERGVGTVVRYDLAEALGALKSAGPYCGRDGSSSPVRLEVDDAGAVGLSASSPDLGSWAGALERVTVHGPAVSVAFNPAYLAGALEAAGDGGALEIRDGLKPAAAYSADGLTVGLVMPVRLPAPVAEPEPAREPERTAEAQVAEAIHEAGTRALRSVPTPEPAEAPEVEPEPEPDDVDAGEGADDVGEPETTAEAGDWAEPSGELARMRADLERAELELERIRAGETSTPARPDVGGFEEWAELLEVGEVGRVHVRVVGGSDGRPAVDVRVYGGSRGYTGRTKAGFRLALEDAAELARIIGDGAEQGAELERR